MMFQVIVANPCKLENIHAGQVYSAGFHSDLVWLSAVNGCDLEKKKALVSANTTS